jgi:hypothetical protein
MTVPAGVVQLAHVTGELALRMAEFLDGYEFTGTDAAGRQTSYTPDHVELALLTDALSQFIADPGTVEILARYAASRQAAEREQAAARFGPAQP